MVAALADLKFGVNDSYPLFQRGEECRAKKAMPHFFRVNQIRLALKDLRGKFDN